MTLTTFFIIFLNPEFEDENIVTFFWKKITTVSIRNSGRLEIKMIKSIDINEDMSFHVRCSGLDT